MKDTVYIVGKRAIFDPAFAEFKGKSGHYHDVGFENGGAILYPLDGQLVLLEEKQSKFKAEHLNMPDTGIYTQSEIKQYLKGNKDNWFKDEEKYEQF